MKGVRLIISKCLYARMTNNDERSGRYLNEDAKKIILQVLQDRQYTQSAFSRIVHCSAGQIHCFLNGRTRLKRDMAQKWFSVLGEDQRLEFLKKYSSETSIEEDATYFYPKHSLPRDHIKYCSTPREQTRKLSSKGKIVIVTEMKRQGVSQEELAKRIGVAQTTVSAWLNSRQGISPSMALKVYNSLQSAASIIFLSEYGTNNISLTSERFFLPSKNIGYDEQRKNELFNTYAILQPFYMSLDEIFRNSEPRRQREILSKLELLITDLETK